MAAMREVKPAADPADAMLAAMRDDVSHLQAAALALSGYTLWVLCDVSLKFAGASALPRLEVIGLVGLVAAALVAAATAVRGEWRSLWPEQPLRQALRSLLDLGNNLCVLVALQHMPLSMFYILIFLSPLVAAVMAWTVLREPLSGRQLLALLAGFAGVAVAVNPLASSHSADRTGYVACAVCVLCFSANMVWSRRLMQTESAGSMTFFSGLVIALLCAAGTAGRLQSVPAPMLLTALAIAGFGVAGNLCFFFALRHARTSYVSQFHYSQLPAGAAIAYVLWREKPTVAMLLGAVLIAAAGVYTAWVGEHRVPVSG